MRISIIMPVLNEAAGIGATLAALQPLRVAGCEVILADGGSEDGTHEAAGDRFDRWISAPRGRANQMNAGASAATGELLLFLHADTRLPANALQWLERFAASDRLWGRFDVRLSGNRPLFRVIAWFMNQRSRLTGVATGDQAIVVRRSLFERVGGYEPIPLMEDVALSKTLRRYTRPYCIRASVITDSRRWEVNGPWRTIVLMWRLRWAYWRGVDPKELARRYRS
ncbi:TIGR04283 family arsenosugar biosynthesis glycosyltransferase [uncultured Halovibrio sp.]|uniref:TIGR04283 family arsenosugar biosynthesis glycosyltransferase n=1 Tax=uncultured Halovibrio sp. TaxID=985049 RepID=UPI0025F7D45F|nr:TIGR04283 family arsenosugar biosynthesis glycosyltransferase [uncultured Halovibrio sp.]